jgi:hypothetical protein
MRRVEITILPIRCSGKAGVSEWRTRGGWRASVAGIDVRGNVPRNLVISVLLSLLIAACGRPAGPAAGTRPLDLQTDWENFLGEIREFERRMGFSQTRNFARFVQDREEFPFCGYVPRDYLPYSYEDPAIQWHESLAERECRALAGDADLYVGATEALGESETPVTPSLLAAPFPRFLYIVFHENCHDQFELPYGIEEALCNLIAYHAMTAFSARKFGPASRDHAAVRRYVAGEIRRTRMVKTFYEQLAVAYARYERGKIPPAVLMRERERIFARAERALGWSRGSLNNVGIANDMTYCRHYPFLERVFEALDHDLARAVEFFRHVDRIKPRPAEVMKARRLTSEESADFIRAYEDAVVATIARGRPPAGGGSD